METKNIYVYVEQREGVLQKVGLELLGEAHRLAEGTDNKVVAVLLGYSIRPLADKLYAYGADEVLLVDNLQLKHYITEPYTKVVTKIIEELKPDIFLYGATSIGRDLAPRVAARVHTGLTADCTSLELKEGNQLEMTRPAFGGNIMATIICPEYRPQMATVRPGVMKLIEAPREGQGALTVFTAELSEKDLLVELKGYAEDDRKQVDITAAKILVSGGRATGGPEGYAPLRELAEVLGAEVSSSRIGVDNGWIEADRQVGQTGKTVRPALYMACGISGAIQHLAGMENAEFVIAINKDESCPMMQMADLGIVGDMKVIIPKLTERLKAYKASQKV